MILEGVITTRNNDGSVNVAPMGPVVDEDVATLLLRPFPGSTTCVNLLQNRCGVFHVVDDVLLIAQGAIDEWIEQPELLMAEKIKGHVLECAARWYEFEVTEIDDSRERWNVHTRIVHVGRGKELFGFNRAKHAIIEASILATRLHLIPRSEVQRQLDWLEPMVTKTGGERETRAFALLNAHILRFYGGAEPS
jgi:uncharacterized protein